MNRRKFIQSTTSAMVGGALFQSIAHSADGRRYDISLAQWSQHKSLKGGTLDNLDWPAYVKQNFQIDALEFVNQFFYEDHPKLGYQPKGGNYLNDLKQRCDDAGVQTLLIMCDRVGRLGDPSAEKRTFAIEGHYAWLDAVKLLGGHSIRVNAASDPKLSWDEQVKLCADGLGRLSEKAATLGLNVIVENHGGLSSNGAWLAQVMKTVGRDNCGTLPDYGNFYVVKSRGDEKKLAAGKKLYHGDDYTIDETGIGYDRYKGVKELMPFAKGVSAKSHEFDDRGEEIHTDFSKMMKIIHDSGYTGHIGVEYEGSGLPEDEGIMATKKLLQKVISEVS